MMSLIECKCTFWQIAKSSDIPLSTSWQTTNTVGICFLTLDFYYWLRHLKSVKLLALNILDSGGCQRQLLSAHSFLLNSQVHIRLRATFNFDIPNHCSNDKETISATKLIPQFSHLCARLWRSLRLRLSKVAPNFGKHQHIRRWINPVLIDLSIESNVKRK